MLSTRPIAVVDIGSNSVRLVVYSSASRAPWVIFNEKVMAGLGRGLDEHGALGEEPQRRALAALGRFAELVARVGVERTLVFATAAVREASNGEEFLAKVRETGFEPRILPGGEEARLAALGVISGIPDADGVIGDLGGGSLELAHVANGEVGRRVSLPLGVLRVAAMSAKNDAALLKQIGAIVADAGFREAAEGRPLYLVGGSWRTLARLDLSFTNHPLPVTHQYEMKPERPRELQPLLAEAGRQELKELGGTTARLPTLPAANLLLRALVETLGPRRLIVSASGVREGLLYDDLPPEFRRRDPLIEAAREVGGRLGRYAQHGQEIDDWITPIFDDDPDAVRLRCAACLLSDIAWAAHPDFRAERGLDMALHGHWVAIDAPGRVRLAFALFTSFGGGPDFPYGRMTSLCRPEDLKRARQWGLAIRLAQRLSGGVADPLRRSSLAIEGDRLVLWLPEDDRALYGEAVDRRLRALASAIGKQTDLVIG